jgi:LPXTG-motif cell wall-anchored protein
MGVLTNSHLFALLMFALLASSLYYFARKKME